MNPEAMEPFGKALDTYFKGDTTAELIIHRDDGKIDSIPVHIFFRSPSELTAIDKLALDLCQGHILDIGAGSGVHSLVLQQKGLTVTSVDISSHAVDIMTQRGVDKAICADIFEFQGGPFDTLLMMGHGIGIVETMDGLDRFFAHVHSLISEKSQILLDSADVRVTNDPMNLAYHEANRREGRYIGEIRLHFEFEGIKGPSCGWLHVDANTLKERADCAGLQCEVVYQEENGNYLARLIKDKKP
jgi:SAM-dependent methyltransferase